MSQQASDVLKSLASEPQLCSEDALFDIDSEGRWFYQNSPLPTKFARLFSGILKKQDQEYFLVTPVEKVRVEVEAEPFKIVDYKIASDNTVQVMTSIETEYSLGSIETFLVSDACISCKLPNGLMASLNRACYYRFIEEFLTENN
ncbi:DUF1285 domain-containing protein [Parashewanella tropica]|uniref:DUF1285 domain-containing protein n=1 Tax=Parashewanella tropica TaxID=2547970 RepID=UPI00105981EB|nr:DUF1285 domain-containing protein [Parashewanella tropica]